MNYYFRCLDNPKAPLFVTDERWEAEEMAKNQDYERVDEQGRKLMDTKAAFDHVQLAPAPKSAADLF